MFTLLLVLLILDGLFLMIIVLLQSGKGDGLAAMGGASMMGSDNFIGGRQAATLLTKATWTSGGLFLGLAFLLSILSTRQERPRSILQGDFQQPPPAAQPALPGLQPAKPGAAPATTPGAAPQGAAPAQSAPAGKPAPAPAPKQ